MRIWLLRLGALFILGYMVLCFAQSYYHISVDIDMPSLPESARGEQIIVRGVIASFPVLISGQSRFYFDVEEPVQYSGRRFYVYFEYDESDESDDEHSLQLAQNMFSLGDVWQLQVKLRPLSGFRNPGLPHYGWTMAARGVYGSAVAHIQETANSRLEDATGLAQFRHSMRTVLFQLPQGSGRALISAIVLGDKTALTLEMRQVLSSSGLSHLLAVSGMHIGIMAAFGFWLGGSLWRLLRSFISVDAVWCSDAMWWKLLSGMACALMYGFLSGMALSTQRALVALVVAAVWQLYFGVVHWASSIAISLVVVLFISPLSPMILDFWLSFGAIGLLLIGLSSQYQSVQPPWLVFIKVQCLLTLGLLPAVALMSGQLSLWSMPLNAVAIPLLSCVIVPGAMLSVMAALLGWMEPLFVMNWFFELSFGAVDTLMQSSWSLIYTTHFTQIQGSVFIFVVICVFVPLYRPMIFLIALLFICVLVPNRPVQGEFWVDVLDVGQGSAIVIRTARHTFLYDTGPRWRSGRDAAQVVILPYLRARSIQRLDTVFISHEDNDHIGGAHSLLHTIEVGEVRASFHEEAQKYLGGLHLDTLSGVRGCSQFQRWWKDGVLLTLWASKIKDSANNRSCLLKIDNGKSAVLLPGDIEIAAEQSLLRSHRRSHLKSDLLIAPHHGSRTSSSTGFINAVLPKDVVFTVSSPSQFKHPHSSVVARYLLRGVDLYSTGEKGAYHWRSEDKH